MPSASALAARLHATRAGSGWVARCPRHDDAHASLSIGRGDDGRVLLRCHAGCETAAVVAALGLTMADLHEHPRDTRQIIATYDYVDEAGKLLYQVVRFDPKDFRQRTPDGAGGWSWRLGDVRRVVYRLPQLQGRTTVSIAEGEKDCDRLWSLGLPATCNAGGAGKWRDEYTQQLVTAGVRRVVILPDNDQPGRDHAAAVARSCVAAGLEPKIVVALPDLPEHGDVSDWLDAGHTRDELSAIVTAAPRYVPDAADDPLDLVTLADVAPEAVSWIWPGRLARGKYSLVAGDPGLGKSTLTLAIAAHLSRESEWPDGGTAPAGRTLILSAEDGIADTIRPRLDRLGGDPSQVVVLRAVRDERGTRPLDLARDLDRLAEAVRRVNPLLVIIDPVTAYLGRTDSYKDAEVRGLLAPLVTLIDQHGVALLAVGHLSKADQRAALHRPGGSIAFVAAARIVLCLAADPADPDRRVLAGIKSNLARVPDSLAFRLPDGRLEWERGSVALDAEALLRPSTPADRDDQTDAEAVIRELLADESAWPIDAKQALVAGEAHGIPDRTMRHTARRLGIQIRKLGFGGGGKWLWHRPPIEAKRQRLLPPSDLVAPLAPLADHAVKRQSTHLEATTTCTRENDRDDVF